MPWKQVKKKRTANKNLLTGLVKDFVIPKD